MSKLKRIVAVASIATFTFPAMPVRSNPALVAAPAICATGVGCVFLGIVVIGAVSYYVWQNSQTGERYRVAIEDPEEERQEWDEPIVARTPNEAERECRARARQYGVELVRVQQPNQVMRGVDQPYRCWFK